MPEPIYKCSKCGVDTTLANDNPTKTFCEGCCPDHDYEYIRGERRHCCITCGRERDDYWGED